MSRQFPPPRLDDSLHRTLLVEAARCWRNARDEGEPPQPFLFTILASHRCEMLAPVFDSLMHLCESALGRALVVGRSVELSGDEHLLLGLVDGSKLRRVCIDCAAGPATALDCAICSTRIMMACVACPRPDPTIANR